MWFLKAAALAFGNALLVTVLVAMLLFLVSLEVPTLAKLVFGASALVLYFLASLQLPNTRSLDRPG